MGCWDCHTTFISLTLKFDTLLDLLWGKRSQKLLSQVILGKIEKKDVCIIRIDDTMKTSNPLFHNKGFKFPAHSQDKSVYFLILGNTLKGEKMHINITKHFFLGFIKPHNPVSKDTFLK